MLEPLFYSFIVLLIGAVILTVVYVAVYKPRLFSSQLTQSYNSCSVNLYGSACVDPMSYCFVNIQKADDTITNPNLETFPQKENCDNMCLSGANAACQQCQRYLYCSTNGLENTRYCVCSSKVLDGKCDPVPYDYDSTDCQAQMNAICGPNGCIDSNPDVAYRITSESQPNLLLALRPPQNDSRTFDGRFRTGGMVSQPAITTDASGYGPWVNSMPLMLSTVQDMVEYFPGDTQPIDFEPNSSRALSYLWHFVRTSTDYLLTYSLNTSVVIRPGILGGAVYHVIEDNQYQNTTNVPTKVLVHEVRPSVDQLLVIVLVTCSEGYLTNVNGQLQWLPYTNETDQRWIMERAPIKITSLKNSPKDTIDTITTQLSNKLWMASFCRGQPLRQACNTDEGQLEYNGPFAFLTHNNKNVYLRNYSELYGDPSNLPLCGASGYMMTLNDLWVYYSAGVQQIFAHVNVSSTEKINGGVTFSTAGQPVAVCKCSGLEARVVIVFNSQDSTLFCIKSAFYNTYVSTSFTSDNTTLTSSMATSASGTITTTNLVWLEYTTTNCVWFYANCSISPEQHCYAITKCPVGII